MRFFALLFAGLITTVPNVLARPQQSPTKAQQPTTAASKPEAAKPAVSAPPPANPADVATPDAILVATYDVISGPSGQKRNWDRFRSLFIPGARLISNNPQAPGTLPIVIDPEKYIAFADGYFDKNGFYEKEVARRGDRYGTLMEIFSTYESRHKQDDAQPFARGVNSFQLFNDGKRWWIVTIYWLEETPELPLPKELLTSPK